VRGVRMGGVGADIFNFGWRNLARRYFETMKPLIGFPMSWTLPLRENSFMDNRTLASDNGSRQE
jgi:hypothetical protein